MLRVSSWLLILCGCSCALAGERLIDFNQFPLDKAPPGFRSVLSGQGKLGDWRVIAEPGVAAAVGETNLANPPKVLAQLSQDGTDERFPILVLDEQTFGDFTLTTRFKLIDGLFEQMAGIAFRIQDTNNYYYVRASAIGNTFRFIKLVNGQRLSTVGPSVEVTKGVWHDLKIECKGNRINCLLDGKELIPPLTDNSFIAGKIGFWTKSDSVSCFGETRINFTPHESLAEILVREALRRYPRLIGLKLYARSSPETIPKIIASSHPDELGEEGGRVEQDVISRDVIYFGKEHKYALVTLPLHDRNGEVAGAVRVVLDSFPGQTEQNAVARARPVVKEMESRIRTAKDLFQ